MDKENLVKEFIRDMSKILSDIDAGNASKLRQIQAVFSSFIISYFAV